MCVLCQSCNHNRRSTSQLEACCVQQAQANEFAQAAERWGQRATQSKESARKTLVGLGIFDEAGNLTNNYR